MAMPYMPYDVKTYQLAEHFLQDTRFNTPAVAHKLAQVIQREIEDYLEWLTQCVQEQVVE